MRISPNTKRIKIGKVKYDYFPPLNEMTLKREIKI